jgi:TadE-like protein
MIFLLFAMLDFARIWTTMMSVESAAREAADYGTTLGAERWNAGNHLFTVDEMRRRACVAASDLPDYEGVDADANGVDEDCTNPTFAYCLTPSAGGTCESAPDAAWLTANTCDNRDRDPPCTVTVTLHHDFYLFVPFRLDFFGVQLGLPVSLAFDRDSTFAMTDIDVAP